MERDVAVEVLGVTLRQSDELTKLLADLAGRIEPDEYQHLKRAIAQLLGELFAEIIRPVVREHPDLRPAGMAEP
jgi:hypothetical protein